MTQENPTLRSKATELLSVRLGTAAPVTLGATIAEAGQSGRVEQITLEDVGVVVHTPNVDLLLAAPGRGVVAKEQGPEGLSLTNFFFASYNPDLGAQSVQLGEQLSSGTVHGRVVGITALPVGIVIRVTQGGRERAILLDARGLGYGEFDPAHLFAKEGPDAG